MSPKKHAYIAELEGWRGAAILFLLLGHFGPALAFPFGRLGVEFFFVLSGRLMAQLLFIDRIDLRDFYVRRISRVFPALWFFCLAMLLATWLTGKFGVEPIDFFRAITFTINYHTTTSVLGHIWSLCIEEHSYVLLSLLALLQRRISVVHVLLVISTACMANGAIQTWAYGLDYYSVYWRTDTRAASILMSAAVFLLVQQRGLKWSSAVIAGSVLSGLILHLSPAVPDPIRYSLGTLFLAFGVANATDLPNVVRAVLASRFMKVAGVLSFSIYLWQQPGAGKDHYILAYLNAAIAAGTLSYFLIEKPARRWINERFTSVRQRSVSASGSNPRGIV